ncbi:MAG TPA: hypothetical protein VFD30_04465 [Terriglobia bacterium]|jgi:hypothetical protein|nr:hypothetical protein [Terriglobia bacterium]
MRKQTMSKWTFYLVLAVISSRAMFAEEPYFLTYNHHMEEPGELEISLNPVFGVPKAANGFIGSTTEIEYGVKAWWTAEFYLDGQSTWHDSTVFTGFRFEDRFRPLLGEHWINPVLYVEFEHLSEADKTMKEVVGFGPEGEHAEPNSETRREWENEIEMRLILSSDFKGWNVAENFIAEKNLSNGPWEFGYAVGASRPLALAASPRPCALCRENFSAGAELYGGVGTWRQFGLAGTSHYIAPVLAWNLPSGTTLRLSPGFGLTETSHRFLLRLGISYELPQFGRRIRKAFH